MLTRRDLLIASVCALPLTAGTAIAQGQFPAKSIRLVVPYPAGGPADVLSRLVAQSVSQTLGQQVVVDNRPGGNAAIGTDIVAKAAPDGYTIGLGANQTHATNQSLIPNLPHDPLRDTTPISGGASIQHVLVVRQGLDVRNVPDLIALAKRRPGTLNYGSTGNGSASHLSAELFKATTGVDIVHIPFRGAPPMVTELVAGRIDLSFATVPGVLGQINGGQIRALAVASSTRSQQLPSLPTLAETGIAGVEADAWFAFFAPAGTPPGIVAILHGAIDKALRDTEIRTKIIAQGLEPQYGTPDQLTTFLSAEVRKWSEIVKISGAKLD